MVEGDQLDAVSKRVNDDCRAAELVAKLARTVHYAWRGILHRDIKPGNIRLMQRANRFTDFGLVRFREYCHAYAGSVGHA